MRADPQAGVQKEAVLEIKRRCGRAKPVVYHVIDKPPPKKSSVRRATHRSLPHGGCLTCSHCATPGVGARRRRVRAGSDVAVPRFPFQGACAKVLSLRHRARRVDTYVAQGAAEGNLLFTFEHVQAFFVRYDSEPLPDFVKKWSVSTLALSKNARHSDRSIVEGFWQALDHSLQMKRSTLQF